MSAINEPQEFEETNDAQDDGIFDPPRNKKLTLGEIRNKIIELSKKVDLSDITAPECSISEMNTRGICVAYIVFIIFSFVGLLGIFIWRYFYKKNRSTKTEKTSPEEVTA